MIIPIRTDYRMVLRPWVNYLLILANVALFVAGYNGAGQHGPALAPNLARIAGGGLLQPLDPQLYQFFTCMFMHGSWQHLLGNMLFLWVFGNAINDRFGQAGYLAFYLAGGVLAGVGYLLLGGAAPVLGASGAIAAVTGAYLVLLPRARVTLLVWLFYLILPLDVSSLYFLLFQFGWNLMMSMTSWIGTSMPSGGVAYVAHSSGYLFGIAVAAALLAGKVLQGDRYDMLSLLRAGRRRAEYRRMVADGYDPFSYLGGGPRRVEPTKAQTATAASAEARELQLRREISQSFSSHDLQGAAQRYAALLETSPEAVLPRYQQLDIANQLMATEQYPTAARAYELFLKHFVDYEHKGDIHLMLGLIYGRYLHQDAVAKEHLQRAVETLRDPRKLELARHDLEAMNGGA